MGINAHAVELFIEEGNGHQIMEMEIWSKGIDKAHKLERNRRLATSSR